ncbi:MAG: hypothetical protein EHM93_10855 [Bacteroidales bacterium]|nr:MAG: hypothetical protein EHM93_10855 [Bacteroidales bacterium]
MKRIRFQHLAFIAVAALILIGCGGVEKMKQLPEGVSFKLTPNPLEVHGNKVKATIEGVIPAKYFNKKAIVDVTPVLIYQGGELPLTVKVLQGEEVQANNQVINYEAGGSFKHEVEFDYKDEMFSSELELRFVISYKDKKIPFDAPYKLGKGVLATYKLVDIDPKPTMLKDNKFERIVPDKKEGQINFVISKADVRKSELTKEEVKMLQDFIAKSIVDSTKEFKGVSVSAYASPDGPEADNEKLSSERGKSTEKWVNDIFKKAKVDTKATNYVTVQSTSEDWEGFQSLISASDVQDKELILRVLSMYSDPAVREKEIKNLSKVYLVLAEKILPQLRRSKMIANINLVGYSDEQLKAMIEGNTYDSLQLEEIMYGVTLIADADKKIEVYNKVAAKYNDIRAINNVAYLYLVKKDLANAKVALEKAAASTEPSIINNRGCVTLLEGDIDGAEKLFASATNAGPDVKYNLGIIAVIKNQYPAAVEYLAGSDSFNQGLSLLLVGKTDAAKNTFQKVDTAKGFYGLAVVGARMTDESMVLNNLRTAIGKDAALKARAKNDLEFRNYFQNDAFKAIVE